MRPPQNAGEDQGVQSMPLPPVPRFNEAPAERGGRRRTERRRRRGGGRFNEAPAERGGRRLDELAIRGLRMVASMRPPQNAGEDTDARHFAGACIPRFNEAPAERGGRRHYAERLARDERDASMRPPQNAGEDGAHGRRWAAEGRGFNEAPAERGGRQVQRQPAVFRAHRFNEAPAERGGRLRLAVQRRAVADRASMRPPQNAGEDSKTPPVGDACKSTLQ